MAEKKKKRQKTIKQCDYCHWKLHSKKKFVVVVDSSSWAVDKTNVWAERGGGTQKFNETPESNVQQIVRSKRGVASFRAKHGQPL